MQVVRVRAALKAPTRGAAGGTARVGRPRLCHHSRVLPRGESRKARVPAFGMGVVAGMGASVRPKCQLRRYELCGERRQRN